MNGNQHPPIKKYVIRGIKEWATNYNDLFEWCLSVTATPLVLEKGKLHPALNLYEYIAGNMNVWLHDGC